MRSIVILLLALINTGLFAQEKLLKTTEESKVGTSETGFDPAEFDAYVQQAVKDWDVLGLAVAVIKDDAVVFEKGYGLREVGKEEPVNMETLFAVASTTKAFTAASLGMLVDEGKVNWDDPVVKHLPKFQLRDPVLTLQVTVRDLLTHRGGLPNTDFLWFDPETQTAEIVQRLEHVEAAYPLRAGFVYQNVMYTVAGEVIEAVSGIPWEEFVRTRIFQPLQMENSVPTIAATSSMKNIARPHNYAGGELRVIENSQADAIGPAGSIWSSAGDMARWMQFLLRGCETESGESLLSAGTCNEMFTPQVILPEPSYPTAQLTEPNWSTYGLGWFQQDYEGRKTDFHTGSLSGMVAIAGMIRDEGIGVYILANRDHAELRHALMYRVFDLFDADLPRDWSREIKALYDEREEKQKTARAKADSTVTAVRVKNTSPGVSLGSYVGTYSDKLYGKVKISKKGEGLRFEYGGTKGELEHWHHDTFRLTNDKPEKESRPLINFSLDTSGKPESVSLGSRQFKRVEVRKQTL